jgi:DNA-binding MarR family transcriptional regulator
MKLEWLGRYRELLRRQIRYNNIYARTCNDSIEDADGISLTAQQWQTLESIVEFEDENQNMVSLSALLGIPASSFSKQVRFLQNQGLVDKYQKKGNRKDIILKPTEKGRLCYQKRTSTIKALWEERFSLLDRLSDEDLSLVEEYLGRMTEDIDPDNQGNVEIFKI